MRQGLKELEKRVVEMEKLAVAADRLIWFFRLPPEERAGLKPGQRIVEEDYENRDGKTVKTVERITDDPSDGGKCHPYWSWNYKAFERDYRITNEIPQRLVWRRPRLPEVSALHSRAPLATGEPAQLVPLAGNGSGTETGARADAAALQMAEILSESGDEERSMAVSPITGLNLAEETGQQADDLEAAEDEEANGMDWDEEP
jgi:hypothetical protein